MRVERRILELAAAAIGIGVALFTSAGSASNRPTLQPCGGRFLVSSGPLLRLAGTIPLEVVAVEGKHSRRSSRGAVIVVART